MNEKIKELAEQARSWVNNYDNVSPEVSYEFYKNAYDEKFAELIIRECVKECQQEWYDLNNAPDETETRAIAIRVGQKNGMLKAISRIKNHFGIKE